MRLEPGVVTFGHARRSGPHHIVRIAIRPLRISIRLARILIRSIAMIIRAKRIVIRAGGIAIRGIGIVIPDVRIVITHPSYCNTKSARCPLSRTDCLIVRRFCVVRCGLRVRRGLSRMRRSSERDRADGVFSVRRAVYQEVSAMSDNYIPRADARAMSWYRAVRNQIAKEPPRFGLLPGDVAAMDAVLLPLEAIMPKAKSVGGRSASLVAAKNTALATCESLFRGYAMLIKADGGVADEDKVRLGIRPGNPKRARIPCPTTSPALAIRSATPGVHTLIYYDPANGDAKRKPRGARSLQLFVGVAAASVVVLDPNECRFYGAFTRSPIGVQFSASDNGRQATYYARWGGRNGQFGPWSALKTMSICA